MTRGEFRDDARQLIRAFDFKVQIGEMIVADVGPMFLDRAGFWMRDQVKALRQGRNLQ
jgi:hypothetical protein